ncbi:hypothetical protein TSAR_007758 [Trichomalopsis sarcophagae]|uniref:Uncharacterized protein n=1 Tax=Trichomalopsis sarcophagae TaxID=543379 RepID=A0A232F6P3_9HYME|nr:hypothetical protein TSAR_007758 [Trichomalopsis sarcophagae]
MTPASVKFVLKLLVYSPEYRLLRIWLVKALTIPLVLGVLPSQYTVDLASELQDRMSRSCNVMIYNVPVDDTPDLVKVRQCLVRISNLNLRNLTVKRFDKPSARSTIPAVPVRFDGSQFEAQRVINNRKLSDGVEVAADRTQYERQLFKRLRAEANAHNSANLNSQKTVRYIHGTPTLVDVTKSSRGHNSGNSKN